MSRRQRSYPRIGQIGRRNAPKACRCCKCGVEIAAKAPCFMAGLQVSWFRGDDYVGHLCLSCGDYRKKDFKLTIQDINWDHVPGGGKEK